MTDNKPDTTLTDGSPVTDDHKDIKENGQQKGYVVLSEEERAKGFVRPLRYSYIHKGETGPEYPIRDLTEEEQERHSAAGYAKYEEYPEGENVVGMFWTQDRLDNIGKGCGTKTTMGASIAETYARNPSFYGGTFCCGCGKHLPLVEFVWEGTDEQVGS